MFVGYDKSVLTVRQLVYRKGTYGVANCSVQITDVVNVGGIVEISEQPIEWTANRKQRSLMNKLRGAIMMYCSLPILLDEYHNILDVTEGALSSRNYNSAGKDKKLDISKRSHSELTWRGELFWRAWLYILMRWVGGTSQPKSFSFRALATWHCLAIKHYNWVVPK